MEANPHLLSLAHDAVELVQMGGRAAQSLLGSVAVDRKADDTPVTEADHRVQAVILDVIAARHPSHAILVEETVERPSAHAVVADAEYCWIVDPIDGTRNFARGSHMYATSVAVLHQGVPLVGAVYDASTGRTYAASRGHGANCDGKPLKVNRRDAAADSVVLISSFRRQEMPPQVTAWMSRYLFRNLGSLCLHLAWVAAGYADAAFSPECKLWDIAAGAVLIEEAGGLMTGPDGAPLWPMDLTGYRGEDIPMLAGAPQMHGELLRSL